MKKLLSTFLATLIGGVSGSLNIANTQENQTFAKEDYWNPVHQVEIRQARSEGKIIGQDPNMTKALYTFNLGANAQFTRFNFAQPAKGYVDWGYDRMGTWNIESFNFAFDEAHNYHLEDINDIKFFPYLKYKLFDETYTAVFASLLVRTYLGYTWYIEDNEYFFQFLVFEYVNTRNSASGAINEINLGSKVTFS
ncbi:MAG: hypothetical protein REH79_02795 [Spiroplasma sp.]|nr:hypothetical protein [Spiroplasma sp.]